jgi:FKBP-type peptidyl-prolyl cis-trans isomerase 2
MTQAKNNDSVKVHYTGKLKDGTVFDSSQDRNPLQFQLGQGQIIPGFEQAVMGMNPGETKTVNIPSNQAYGPHLEELIQEVPRQQLPTDMEFQVGQRLQLGQEKEQPMIVEVTEVTDASIKLDANHPLAGKELIFDIELLEII